MTTTEPDRETIVAALAFLAVHHEKMLAEAEREAEHAVRLVNRTYAANLVKHHTERLRHIGEQIALFGGRNAWPRNELQPARPTGDTD